ncbi:cytochrome P450-like protein [Schizothecium vesticola]|uniref:Cytochrome P450-like protein n=1 Tax=Schizothecium vesticola TaxID=314040 RepID=A0AA40F3Z9_9PEZI|nr:cytochrome P450-like protein [Schizothecium vesticola]
MSTPIPQPRGLPLLGNILDINPNNTWWSLKTLAEKHGEIFQINVLGHKIVFVASAALADEICDEKRFRKYVGGPIVEIRALSNDGLFSAYDHEEAWGVAHRIIAPMLSPDSVAALFADLASTTDELIAKWSALPATSNTVAPFEQLTRLTLEATTLSFFGKKLNSLDGPPHPVLQAMEDTTSECMKRPSRPKLLTALLYNSKWKRAIKIQRDWAADILAFRAANPPSPDRHDLLWALQHGVDPVSKATLSDSQVIDEIITMPIGTSTAPCALAAMLVFLAQNPAALTRARAELDAVVGPDHTALTHAHVAAQLPYVEAVVRETLRLSCAAPGFNIEPVPRKDETDTSPVLLGGGKYAIAHNQAMIIVLHGVNRDPAVFDEPLEFRPERMLGEAFEKLPAGVKKWFGNGKRACIGRHWAWEFLVIVAAKIIMAVDWELVDGGYQMKQDGWFNVRPVALKIKVKTRARE